MHVRGPARTVFLLSILGNRNTAPSSMSLSNKHVSGLPFIKVVTFLLSTFVCSV